MPFFVPWQGIFLVGFTRKDGDDVAAWFHTVEPGFPVSHCAEELMEGTLGEALYNGQDGVLNAMPRVYHILRRYRGMAK